MIIQYCFSVIAAFLIISCVLLIITIMVYSYHKSLLNDYTRLMRHYAIQLCIALMLLAIAKIWTHDKFSVSVCRFIGKYLYCYSDEIYILIKSIIIIITTDDWHILIFQFLGFCLQYFFISSFGFMCSMAIYTWCKIRWV